MEDCRACALVTDYFTQQYASDMACKTFPQKKGMVSEDSKMFSCAMASVGFECPFEVLIVRATWPRDCAA